MKKLQAPKYGWKLVRELSVYAIAKTAKDPWKSGKKSVQAFKDTATTLMLAGQSNRCAYCGCHLFEKFPHRDHIAPQVNYLKWTFWPENLLLACYTCNSDRKKVYDPVVGVGKSYRTSTFKFVHPYLDDPKEHIDFAGDGMHVLIRCVNDSPKGQETIDLFDLASPERSKQRAQEVLFDSDVDYLHGDLLVLFKQAAIAAIQNNLTLKMT